MAFDFDSIAKLLSPALTLIIGAFLKRIAERRAKVVSFVGHVSSFTLAGNTGETFVVHTHSIVVKNSGKKQATNVRIGHTFLPDHITIYPSIQYRIEINPSGNKEIIIPVLVPKEQITISYLYNPPLTIENINSYTKHDEGFANVIRTIPMPEFPRWVNLLVTFLMFMGATLVIYLITLMVAAII